MLAIETIRQIAQERFGHDHLNHFQEHMLAAIMAGHSCLGVARTAEGKSLCYQLPAAVGEGLTVVVEGLQALMRQQAQSLDALGIPAACLTADTSMAQAQEIYRRMHQRELRLLYVSPERLSQETFIDRLRQAGVTRIAVDEAHLISEWSFCFRPDYFKIGRVRERLGNPQVIAVTATAPPEIRAHIQAMFGIEDRHVVLGPICRPEIAIRVVDTQNRIAAVRQALRRHETGSAVVYTARRKTAEEIADQLRQSGVDAVHYHAGVGSAERRERERAFLAGDGGVIVSTTAFGMGVDKPDIRSVILYDPPKSVEDGYQQIGRAARDGQPGTATILWCEDTLAFYRERAEKSRPSLADVRGFLGALEHTCVQDGAACLGSLAYQCDLRPEVGETIVAWLEMAGYLRTGGSYWNEYRLSKDAPWARLPSPINEICATGKRGTKWLTIHADRAAVITRMETLQVVAHLNRIPAFMRTELKTSRRITEVFARASGFTSEAIAYHRSLDQHLEQELRRLEQVRNLLASGGGPQAWRVLEEHFAGGGECDEFIAQLRPTSLQPSGL